jgi:hypothetical protein
MKVALKQTYLLFLVLSLTLVLADCNFIDNAFSHHIINAQRECSDLSDNSDPSILGCFEDEVFINDSRIKSAAHAVCVELVPTINTNFNSPYFSSIWQPPKFS